ncbi:MAG: hypothetical protein JNK29_06510, partial [Anaerolineales bacterium]|nr:hypothetical protein [Anaerolineales bacterium]
AGAPRDISFFVQLLGPDGRLYGQSDVSYPAGRYTAGEVLLDRHTLYILPEAPPGPYTLTAGAYTPDGVRVAETTLAALTVPPAAAPAPTANAGRWSIVAADLVGFDVDRSLADAQRLYLHWELGPRAEAGEWAGWPLAVPAGLGYATTALDLPPGDPLPAPLASALRRGAQTAAARYVPFGEDLVLTRATVTPPAVRPGGRVTVELEFLAAHSITHDLTLKLELTGPGWRTQLDTTPVGGGLPTLKWTAGARLRDQYVLTVPTEAAPGPAQLALGWYDAFTQADLPILDPRLAQLGPAALIGTLEVLP